jgi:hypothetical protein
MADVFLNLIDPLELRFSWKDKSQREIEIARRDMVEAFRHHEVTDLKGATMRIIMGRKFSTMPTVAEINETIIRVMTERKAEEAKAKVKPLSPSLGSPLAAMSNEKEDAKARARDWLRNSPLGQQSLSEGWCQQLHNIIWQIYYRRSRMGRPIQHWDEIKLDDVATETKSGEELIKTFKGEACIIGPALMRAIVLKENVA